MRRQGREVDVPERSRESVVLEAKERDRREIRERRDSAGIASKADALENNTTDTGSGGGGGRTLASDAAPLAGAGARGLRPGIERGGATPGSSASQLEGEQRRSVGACGRRGGTASCEERQHQEEHA